MRNRAVSLLLVPVVILIWIAGWVLYWEGSRNTLQDKKTTVEDDGIEMAVAVFEEYEESKN